MVYGSRNLARVELPLTHHCPIFVRHPFSVIMIQSLVLVCTPEDLGKSIRTPLMALVTSPSHVLTTSRRLGKECRNQTLQQQNNHCERNGQRDNMLRSNRPRLPADVFSINDQVKCVNPRSKHYGHTAKVIGMGKTRLNVTFDNGHVGKFIDWRDATLVVRPNDHVSTTPTINTTSTTRSSFEDITNNLDQLTTLMEHLAFTSATVISSNYADSQHMEALLTQFDQAVRANTRNIAHARQSTNDNRDTSSDILP
jgi:hypothetical protein